MPKPTQNKIPSVITEHHPLYIKDIFSYISSFLSVKDLYTLRKVNKSLAKLSKDVEEDCLNKLNEEDKKTLQKMDKNLRLFIRNSVATGDVRVNQLFQLLNCSQYERKAKLEAFMGHKLPQSIYTHLLSETGLILILFNLIPPEEFTAELCQPFMVTLLAEKLIDITNIKLIKANEPLYGWHLNLKWLMSENGVKALRTGLVNIQDAPYLPLQDLLSNEVMAVLSAGTISAKLIAEIRKTSKIARAVRLTEPSIISILKQGIISFKHFDPNDKNDIDRATAMYENIKALCSAGSEEVSAPKP